MQVGGRLGSKSLSVRDIWRGFARFIGDDGPVSMCQILKLRWENGKKSMRIRITGAPDPVASVETPKPITKEERDHLFDVVVSLANYADDKGLGAVSDKLEETLDMLLEPGESERAEFASSRQSGWASPRRNVPLKRGPALMSELKKARRRRLSSLS